MPGRCSAGGNHRSDLRPTFGPPEPTAGPGSFGNGLVAPAAADLYRAFESRYRPSLQEFVTASCLLVGELKLAPKQTRVVDQNRVLSTCLLSALEGPRGMPTSQSRRAPLVVGNVRACAFAPCLGGLAPNKKQRMRRTRYEEQAICKWVMQTPSVLERNCLPAGLRPVGGRISVLSR